MRTNALVQLFFAAISFNYGIASSYEEENVYTQALLTITFNKDSSKTSEGGHTSSDIRGAGKYGKDSPKTIERGYLYWLPNYDWCKDSKVPTSTKGPHDHWIALIPKGNCTYKEKIMTAKGRNASAVLVYNNVKGPEIPVIQHEGTGNTVTVMIKNSLGQRIIDQYKLSEYMDCVISVGPHYVDRRWKVSRTSVLFVLVSFILLMCISLAWLVFYYVQRFRYIYRNDRKEKQLLNAAKKAISKLKTISFHANGSEEEEPCVICLENYKENETLRVLPCKHEFHKSCIDPWLLNHRTCPMCKSNILKSLGVDIPENFNHSDSESANHTPQTAQMHRIAEAPSSPSPELPVGMVVVEAGEPSNSNQDEAPSHSASSSVSIASSDRSNSTVALVSSAQRV